MLLSDTMAIFFVIMGLLITFPCLWLLCSALWPRWVNQCADAVENGVLKSFFIGIPIVVVFVVLVVVVGKLPASLGQIGGIMAFCLTMLYGLIGVAGLAKIIGRRLESPADIDRPWKGLLRGAIVLVLTYLLPLVGWFLILPGSLIIGAGSSTRVFCARIASFFRRKKVPTVSASIASTVTTSRMTLADPMAFGSQVPNSGVLPNAESISNNSIIATAVSNSSEKDLASEASGLS